MVHICNNYENKKTLSGIIKKHLLKLENMVVPPQKLIVHYHHCSIKDIGDIYINYLNVQLFFLKNVLNCSFLLLVEEIHPYSNYGSYPYAFNTLEGNTLNDVEIIDYMKNVQKKKKKRNIRRYTK
ncbi:hypothetical protein PFNF54_05733 [Plasmodium falciparum NF54]|uniref:Uncharacterized protein n=1 Tax=Plasmodium falciparum (isolate NF54) TaxID=5843 RepID=W7JLI9_PLAFO|nr:hypothetical protein PFNF54_05733 [Plasmodium falciparum NF54]